MSMSHSSAPPDGREVSTTHTLLLTKSDSVTVTLPGEKEAIAAVSVCACVCVYGGRYLNSHTALRAE